VSQSASVPTAAARTFAWAGAALFAGALIYFLFTYLVTFEETAAAGAGATPIVWDVALFTVFALHHSVFARLPVRALIARAAGGGLERSVYVWVASLLLIAVCALWRPVPGVVWTVGGAAVWVLAGLQLVAVWLTLGSAVVIDVWELAGVRLTPNSQTPDSQPTQSQGNGVRSVGRWSGEAVGNWEFKTTGPYGWVRHPIYSGWFLLVFATPSMTMTRFVFAATSAAYLLVAIPLEERSLAKTAGAAYARYLRQVRWRLVPGIY
jgi:methanethiol S-methyltransferase